MTLPQRRWLGHVPPPGVRAAAFFITICCQERERNQLCKPEVSAKLFEAVRHYHEQLRWHVWLWVLMPDHLHGLVGLSEFESLGKLISAWKRHTARHTGIKWQKGFFDHRIRQNESFQEKADYIRMNPVRKGLVATPEAWPYIWQPNQTHNISDLMKSGQDGR